MSCAKGGSLAIQLQHQVLGHASVFTRPTKYAQPNKNFSWPMGAFHAKSEPGRKH